jgi:outer membrane biosynthesis protein TonB
MKLQEMGFCKEEIMELVKAGDPAGEVAGTEPEPKPEPAPEPKPEPAPAPEPKPEEKNTTDVSAVLNKLDTLISAIQSSNRINAEISDVKSNQQIVDDMLANIVNPTYSK